MKRLFCALGMMALALMPRALAAQTQLLIVSGLAGEPRFETEFHSWASTLVDAAANRYKLRPEQIIYLADKPDQDRTRIDGRSTKVEIERVIGEMAGRAGPNDRVMILLIGHGAADSQGSRLNLSGPDLSATELAALLGRFTTQRVVVVNAASASGEFQQALTGRNRAIITATRSGLQTNETIFAKFFVQSFANDGADTNKDGQTTMLEAFQYTQAEVERHYKDANHLQTEHSVLGGDQEIARSFALVAGSAAPPTAASAELRGLLEQRDRIQASIEALRARRESMTATQYETELENLAVELALKNREIRALEGNP